METAAQIENLLSQLKTQTGISFSLASTDYDSEGTISALKGLLRSANPSATKADFLRSLLLGSLSPKELSLGIQQFNLKKNQTILPILLESRQALSSMGLSVLQNFISSSSDEIIFINDSQTCILHKVESDEAFEDLFSFVSNLHDFLEAEAFISVTLAFDKVCTSLEQLPNLYSSISNTMDIGRNLYPNQHIFAAQNLGLGQIISELPLDACKNYLSSHFNNLTASDLDAETLHTITVFLENDLNIAECARKLYLHRNTLIYRLDKIEKLTGLDIRHFDDAMTCKLALMMSNFLNS